MSGHSAEPLVAYIRRSRDLDVDSVIASRPQPKFTSERRSSELVSGEQERVYQEGTRGSGIILGGVNEKLVGTIFQQTRPGHYDKLKWKTKERKRKWLAQEGMERVGSALCSQEN